MYSNCIFCSADLGSNDSLEEFPVGRSLAFDAAKGRLWAVCGRCARWNLAPIEERWEAIEQGERLFRDCRLRAQSENVGMAKLRDGTRLIRVGAALPGELAVWRYGESLRRRRQRHLMYTGTGIVLGGGLLVTGVVGAGLGVSGLHLLFQAGKIVRSGLDRLRPLARLTAVETGDGEPAVIQRGTIEGAALFTTHEGLLGLRLPALRKVEEIVKTHPGSDGTIHVIRTHERDLVLHGASARRVLSRAMVHVNARGARRDWLEGAVGALARAESPGEYVMRTAREGHSLSVIRHEPARNLALEMALHEETERRAMEGELAMLEQMWRDAEEIAAIADRLPDGLPPRL